ncbi:ABC transporter permease [Halocatena halophila]|uniref:ABC transporter permease n=1 Tax=Halocatena halophila TaxID=2814576 RepID=UPI002ED46BB7
MKWLYKRLMQFVITVFVVMTLSFGLVRFMPGGPMDYIRAQALANAGTGTTRTLVLETSREALGFTPDAPLHVQYFNYITDILMGDLGISIANDEPVSAIIAEALPWTLFLMVLSMTIMFVGAIVIGAFMAYRESGRLDTGLTSIFAVLNSTPYYIVALLLLSYMAFELNWFPKRGRVAPFIEPGFTVEFIYSALYHATLPVISIVITGIGGIALQMRGNAIQILGEDYLHVGRLRGIPERRLTYRYVARNAILPMYTQFMIKLGTMFGGAVVLEQIFTYQGIGKYMFEAISMRDYPLMMGCFLVITLAVVTGVFIADMTYGLIDPRISTGGESNESF